MRVLVTGANGFIGKALCSELEKCSFEVVRAVRGPAASLREVSVGEITAHTCWSDVLKLGIDSVVHLAGQVPISESAVEEQSDQYLETNVFGTEHLAQQCSKFGVGRFVFLSTVKVLGEGGPEPYHDGASPTPAAGYAASKWGAEKVLHQFAGSSKMEVVVLRPPLVYGPGVKGNFLRLLQAVDQRRVLPFGAIRSRRSMIYVGNLVDVIRLCLAHPGAAGHTFLVSDQEDISIPDLVRRISSSLGKSVFLVPVPVPFMQWLGWVLGKRMAVDRLLGSLSVDSTGVLKRIGWAPPYTMDAGLSATVDWYRKSFKSSAAAG
jgi:nucleoside-diphosphate-sugar epimerase